MCMLGPPHPPVLGFPPPSPQLCTPIGTKHSGARSGKGGGHGNAAVLTELQHRVLVWALCMPGPPSPPTSMHGIPPTLHPYWHRAQRGGIGGGGGAAVPAMSSALSEGGVGEHRLHRDPYEPPPVQHRGGVELNAAHPSGVPSPSPSHPPPPPLPIGLLFSVTVRASVRHFMASCKKKRIKPIYI